MPDPFEVLAAANGWGYRRRILAHRDTPFLHLGDGADAGPCFTLRVLDRNAELYAHERISGDGIERAPAGSFVVLRLLDPIHLAGIDQLRLMPRDSARAAAAPLNDRRVVELESLELDRLFLLEAGSGTDELTIRRLFTPALISALLELARADCYLGEFLDYAYGRVMLASGGTITATDGPALEATLREVAPVLGELLRFADSA